MSAAGDHMRQHLITRAACAKCGGALNFSCEQQPAWKPSDDSTGLTGAAEATIRFAVWPCQKCYGEAKRPLDLLRQALTEAK